MFLSLLCGSYRTKELNQLLNNTSMNDTPNLPKPNVAKRETTKRIKIIEDILPEIMKYSKAILLAGTMAYGQDFSIDEDSPIVLNIITDDEQLEKIGACKFFQKYNTEKIRNGFRAGIFHEFTLSFLAKEITVECHFWNEKVWKEITQYRRETITRLRSQTKKIYANTAYSFDGDELQTEHPDYKKEIHNVGELPVYTIKDDKIFVSQPLSDILICIKLYDECDAKSAIRECKNITKQKLADTKKKADVIYSLFNTLPYKTYVSPEVAESVEDTTIS